MLNPDWKLPKISCLLVTANGRFDYFRRSCQCYDDQTYANRELVVVNEGPSEYQEQIRAHLANRADVRFVFLNGQYTLGALRNISIALASGDLFVQWDDDDFNAPTRLATQYAFLAKHPTAKVCFLSDQLHYYFSTRQLFWESWSQFHSGGYLKYSLIPGTIMAYRKDFDMRYPSLGPHCRSGEDSVLAFQMTERHGYVALLSNVGHLQVYSYHGQNVWGIEHHLKISKERALPSSFLLANRELITETLNYLQLNDEVLVTGRDGLAFTVRGKK